MKSFLLALFMAIPICASSQTLHKIGSQHISVSYDKTVHLIYPSPIKYVKSVDSIVAVDKPEEAKRIVRIKANQRRFSKNTTISVATADGKFYSYLTSYSDSPQTTIFIGKESPKAERIECSNSSDVHIVAPAKVTYIDFGNDSISASLAEGTQNIIRLQAKYRFSKETNLSFALEDGTFYSYDIAYRDYAPVAVYTLNAPSGNELESVILEEQTIGGNEQEKILSKVKNKGRSFYSLGIQKYKQKLSIRNIFTYKERTILDIEFSNNSEVPYDVEFFKFIIKSKKANKRVATQDLDLTGEIVSSFTGRIAPKRTERIIVVFPKFTLSDDQNLELNVVEQSGGRNIAYLISDESLNNATAL